MNQHTQIIKDRLTKAVTSPILKGIIAKDYSSTFNQLGVSQNESDIISKKIFDYIIESKTFQEVENKVTALFRDSKVGEKNIFDLIHSGLADRVNKITTQVTPYLRGISGKVFDYGMGSGEITQKLKDELGLDIEGGDVRDFRSTNVTVPFVLLKDSDGLNGKIVDVPNLHYQAALLTNVIYHEKVNEAILRELDRIVAKKLVIIETVPVGKTPEEIALDHERTFANDVLWNRFFNNADIPVPGTYETPEDWTKRFESFGWKTAHSEDLGFDQKSIRDVHHLLVFER